MALERERKFLITKKDLDILAVNPEQTCLIEQGYLLIEEGYHGRIRITTNLTTGKCVSELGFKVDIRPGVKDEYEMEVSNEIARGLYDSCEHKLVKKRVFFIDGVTIDIYPDGDQIIEIEYNDDKMGIEHEKFVVYPAGEVTYKKEYSNISKAISGLNLKF